MSAIQDYLGKAVSPTGLASFCPTSSDLFPSTCKTLIIVPYNATVTPPATTQSEVLHIRNMFEAASYYGAKTAAYRAISKALCACPTGQSEINVLALPMVAGVSAEYALAIGGPAAATHTKTVSLFGKDYVFVVPMGSTVAIIAGLLKAELDADNEFPFTATVTATGLTLVANDGGTFGEGLTLQVSDSRVGVTIADTIITLTQAIAPSGVMNTTTLSAAVGACCYPCVISTDNTPSVIDAIQAYVVSIGACGPDYCGSMLYFARKESFGTSLAFGNGLPGVTQAYNAVVVGLQVNSVIPYPAYDIAITRGVMACCAACQNPGDPLQNNDSKMLCLPMSKGCKGFYSRSEINQLFGAGWTVVDVIEGYLGVEAERTFHRWDDVTGRPTLAYSDPTQIRIANWWWSQRLRPWLLDNYGSSILFKNGTTFPLRGVANDAPAFLSNTKTVTPDLLRGAIVAYMEQDVGVIFDDQTFRDKVFAFGDDQIRGLCQGDPRIVAVFFDKVGIARPLRHVFLSFNYTTRTC